MSPQHTARAASQVERVADPALQSILRHLIERDALDREAWTQMGGQVSNLSVVTQGLQNDVARLIVISERQLELQVESSANAQKLATLREQFHDEKAERLLVSAAAQRFEGSVRALKWIIGATLPIGVLLVGFVYSTLTDRVVELQVTHTKDIVEATAAREKLRDKVDELSARRVAP